MAIFTSPAGVVSGWVQPKSGLPAGWRDLLVLEFPPAPTCIAKELDWTVPGFMCGDQVGFWITESDDNGLISEK